jgi:hypothetical protein
MINTVVILLIYYISDVLCESEILNIFCLHFLFLLFFLRRLGLESLLTLLLVRSGGGGCCLVGFRVILTEVVSFSVTHVKSSYVYKRNFSCFNPLSMFIKNIFRNTSQVATPPAGKSVVLTEI